jgi:hypothetical protein
MLGAKSRADDSITGRSIGQHPKRVVDLVRLAFEQLQDLFPTFLAPFVPLSDVAVKTLLNLFAHGLELLGVLRGHVAAHGRNLLHTLWPPALMLKEFSPNLPHSAVADLLLLLELRVAAPAQEQARQYGAELPGYPQNARRLHAESQSRFPEAPKPCPRFAADMPP